MRKIGHLFVPGQLFKNMSQADNIVDVGTFHVGPVPGAPACHNCP
jgi:hypothetical protein